MEASNAQCTQQEFTCTRTHTKPAQHTRTQRLVRSRDGAEVSNWAQHSWVIRCAPDVAKAAHRGCARPAAARGPQTRCAAIRANGTQHWCSRKSGAKRTNRARVPARCNGTRLAVLASGTAACNGLLCTTNSTVEANRARHPNTSSRGRRAVVSLTYTQHAQRREPMARILHAHTAHGRAQISAIVVQL